MNTPGMDKEVDVRTGGTFVSPLVLWSCDTCLHKKVLVLSGEHVGNPNRDSEEECREEGHQIDRETGRVE
jgi:hypothetical protein